jgi:hypothetical protein
MSNLQCPARFLLVAGADQCPAESLAESLRTERVAAVYDGPPQAGGAAALAEGLAAALDVPLHEVPHRPALRDVIAHEPQALAPLRELADLHRGEAVAVVADGVPGQRLGVLVDGDGVDLRTVTPEGGT